MRRLLLAHAGLVLLACAGASRSERPAQAAAETKPVVVPGMERQPDEVVSEYDLTHDGKPDVWKYARKDATGKETVVRKERDLNGDGKVDSWEANGPAGEITRLVYDLDFDGKPDATLFFEKDQLVRKELATGFDGIPRTWSFYEKGKLVRKERDTNGDGKVDYWEYWESGEIDRVGVDVDSDGQVDRWEARRQGEPTADAGAQK